MCYANNIICIKSREPQHDNDTYENHNIVKLFRFAMGINLRVWPPPAMTLTDEPCVCVFLAISVLQVCGDEQNNDPKKTICQTVAPTSKYGTKRARTDIPG